MPYTSFTFSVRDQALAFEPAPRTMTVDVTPVDDLPLAAADTYGTSEDVALNVPAGAGVLANDSGLGDGGLVLSVVGPVTGGAVALNNDGSFTFTPAADFNGAASFTYQVQDADGDGDTAVVTINVAPVDDLPVATNDVYAATEDTVLNVPALTGVLANDTGLGDGPLTLSVVGAPSAAPSPSTTTAASSLRRRWTSPAQRASSTRSRTPTATSSSASSNHGHRGRRRARCGGRRLWHERGRRPHRADRDGRARERHRSRRRSAQLVGPRAGERRRLR